MVEPVSGEGPSTEVAEFALVDASCAKPGEPSFFEAFSVGAVELVLIDVFCGSGARVPALVESACAISASVVATFVCTVETAL